MDYELCKQLKDAGFPINGSGDFLERSIEIDESGIITTNSVYVPTLSELIEACGKGFHELTRYDSNWSAVSCDGKIDERGSTPEEAVALLWLALNK